VIGNSCSLPRSSRFARGTARSNALHGNSGVENAMVSVEQRRGCGEKLRYIDDELCAIGYRTCVATSALGWREGALGRRFMLRPTGDPPEFCLRNVIGAE